MNPHLLMKGHPGENEDMDGSFSFVTGFNDLNVKEGSDDMNDTRKGHQSVVEWLKEMLPHVKLSLEASEEELRACLRDGTVFCNLLNQFTTGSFRMGGSLESARAKLERFLTAMDEMALPRFLMSDLEQGDLLPVLQSLRALKASFSNGEFDRSSIYWERRWSMPDTLAEIDFSTQDANIHDGSQNKEIDYTSISDAKILELMKSSDLQTASTELLFRALNKILDESNERMNENGSHSVTSLLRTIMGEIECRISTQAEDLKHQNALFKLREEKYQSRIKVSEVLAEGITEEKEIVTNQMKQIELEKAKVEEKEKVDEQDPQRLKTVKDHCDAKTSKLKHELDVAKMTHKKHCLELEARAEKIKTEHEKNLGEWELRLAVSRLKVKELEAICASNTGKWEEKECAYQSFIDNKFEKLQGLKATSELIKHELIKTQKSYTKDLKYLGKTLRRITDAVQNHQIVLKENRRLYNEIQDLKGNIRVYCRIKPFSEGKSKKQTPIEHIGENGELIVSKPSKQGKDTHKLFKFNKVFGPAATQEEVYIDTQPLVRSVLDGYNVCIFAYGQTGSGKTYTMSGPSMSSKEDWGVNYRAINDLFQISQSRQNSVQYEVDVQMVEIYNEQVRDLLSSGGSQRRLGISNTIQPYGLAVPDAIMHSVKSTNDVLELMSIGLMNRSVGATASNQRSSRSHSVLMVHVRGVDLDTDSELRGSLHLIDLAGSERLDHSKATGERLKEAQYINKSLSALGDVIFALAQKSSHVPYRNSKLTQVLQSSLGGQAKTLMFVQINPESYFESISTLKFAERVSGIELGAARSNKESPDVRKLMEKVSSLKDIIAKKDEEIDKLQHLKGNAAILKRGLNLRYESISPRRHSLAVSHQGRSILREKCSGFSGMANLDAENYSMHSDRHSEAESQNSLDEIRHRKELLTHVKSAGDVEDWNLAENVEIIGLEGADPEERSSDISGSYISIGTGTDISVSSSVLLRTVHDAVEGSEDYDAEKTERLETVEKAKISQREDKAKKAQHSEKANSPSISTNKPKLRRGQARPSPLSNTSTITSSTSSSSSKTSSNTKRTMAGKPSSMKHRNRRQ